MEALIGTIDPAAPIRETIAAMVRQGASALTLFARIAADLGEDEANIIAFRALGDRLEALLAPAVEAARARGELSADVTTHHIVLTVRMAGSLIPTPHDAGRTERLPQRGSGPAVFGPAPALIAAASGALHPSPNALFTPI
ncbi:MAG: hypothetical protein PGN08_16725 [Sphingomonas taxi]